MDKIVDSIQLINCVKNRPELYDPSNIKYMDLSHKNSVWNEIAEEIGIDSVTCKTKWSNIRDNYRKSLRKSLSHKIRSGRSVKHYKYAEHLQFLLKFFDCDEIGDGLAEGDILDVEVKIEDEGLAQPDFQEPISDGESHCPSPVQRSLKRAKISQHFMDQSQSSPYSSPNHYNLRGFEQERSLQAACSTSHAVDAFLAGLAPTLKNLSALNWHLAKSEIFAVVQKYELITITKEDSKEKCANRDH